MKTIFNVNDVAKKVNLEEIPSRYCWSGNTHSIDEFEDKNFLRTVINRHRILICASENVVALCDYLSNELLHLDFIHDMDDIFSPEYDIWLSLHFEQELTYLEEFPVWVQDMVHIFMEDGIIQRFSINEKDFFLLLDSDYYWKKSFPKKTKDALENKCRENVFNYWLELLEDYGCLEEMPEPDCGKWGQDLFEQFKSRYADVDIVAWCGFDDGSRIGLETIFSYNNWPSNDMSWIFDEIPEAFPEDWEEFEFVAMSAKKTCKAYYSHKNIIPKSEEEVKDISLKILAEMLGPCNIEYEINGKHVDLPDSIDNKKLSMAIYEGIHDNFEISESVTADFRSK